MMSKKQFACMLALHITYLLVGASIFYHIESPLEVAQRAEDKLERIEIQNLLYENYIPDDPDKQESILRKLSDYCGKPVYNYTTEDKEAPYKWDFYHSFFFSYTVVSTIGYGNLAPTTHLSRILMIFYGLFGIPINGILLANLGEYFGHQLISVYRKYKRKNNKRADNLNYFFSNLGMLGQIFLYLVPGFLFFIFLPACIFVVFEGWDYVASVYYAFVTLTTIGFGDLVAGTINNGFKDGYFFTYQIFLIVWITFGLGYIVMLLGFITSGMRSEGVHRLEQKLATQLKSTQNRILQGFSKDLNVLRKIINEANLVKLKPIYVEPAPFLYRSQSCPDFTFDVEPRGPIVRRKRANSENIHMMAKDILRIQSDTNLLGIDKEKTFTASAIVKPAELLARVVNVLGGLEQQQQQHHPEKGIHMFDDDQILSSEKPPVFSIGSDIITNSPKRMRASSVSVPIQRKDSMSKLDHELTWTIGDSAENFRKEANIRSGKLSLPATAAPHLETDENSQPKSILHKLFLRKTSSTESPPESIKHNVSRVTIDPHVTDNVKEKPKMRRGSIFPKFHFDDEDEDVAAVRAYQQKTKRHSIFPTFDFDEEEDDNAARYKETTRRGRHSIFPTFNFDDDDDDEVDEDEVRKYQNRTNRGRMSLFPTFGKKRHDSNEKKDDDDDDTVDEEEVQKYQNRTNKGRMSLFPTFGKRKNDSDEKKDDDVIDEDEVRSYRNRTNKGRMSLFPTFGKKRNDSDEKKDDDEPIDEDEVQSYQNRTNKGRLSLFPTFGKKRNDSDENKDDEDDTVDEEEVRKYQNRTNKGRLSLFPSFGKSKKHDDEVPMPESSDDLENYKSKTSRGRGSLFPTFGKERKNSSPKGSMSDLEASIRQYQNQSKKGRNGSSSGESRGGRRRGSLFDADLNIESLPQTEQVEVLEHTSVADLLRALAVLETVQGSDNSSEPRGLLDLIAQPTGGPNRRRGSIRPELILPSIPQRADTDSGSGPRRRRLSAKSTAPQFTPTLATVVAGAELQLTAAAARENRMSMLAQAPPPYTETANEDGPAPPRVRRYSPAPIENMRSTTAPVPRMFSRIRKESVASVEEEDSRRGSLTDVVIDNNKDKT